jgi:hypothetical protein
MQISTRKVLTAREEETIADVKQFGTRAKGTECLVYRVLQTPEYRTEDVLARFLDAAFTPPLPQGVTRKRARKLLAIIARRGDSGIPKNVWELVSWSELSADEAAGTIEAILMPEAKQRRARRTTRHFRPCKQCGARFLAKRSDQEFHTPKCRVRWNRSNRRTVTDKCHEPSGTRINIGDNEAVFTVPLGSGTEAHPTQTPAFG